MKELGSTFLTWMAVQEERHKVESLMKSQKCLNILKVFCERMSFKLI